MLTNAMFCYKRSSAFFLYAALCYVILCGYSLHMFLYAMLCFVMLCSSALCYVTLRYAM